MSLAKHLYSPWALGKAFLIPFVLVMGLHLLVLLGVSLLSGADISEITGGYLDKALGQVFPIVRVLVSIWLIYFFILYAPAAYTTSESLLNTIGRSAKQAILSLIRRLVSQRNIYIWRIPALSEVSWVAPLAVGAAGASAGWSPGVNPHIK